MYVFSSETCAPCKHIKPFIAELKEDYSEYAWKDVDLNSPEASTLNVKAVPTMVVVNNSKVVGSHSGTQVMGYLVLLKKAKQPL